MTADILFAPVQMIADLDALDGEQVFQGYMTYAQGAREPVWEDGRAFWHGWCNARRDHGHAPATEASARLAHAVDAAFAASTHKKGRKS